MIRATKNRKDGDTTTQEKILKTRKAMDDAMVEGGNAVADQGGRVIASDDLHYDHKSEQKAIDQMVAENERTIMEKKEAKKVKFGGHGLNVDSPTDVLEAAREIFRKVTGAEGIYTGGFNVYPVGVEGTKRIKPGHAISVNITTTADYNDASQGFEIWLTARIRKMVRKTFDGTDIDKAKAWIAKKEQQIAALFADLEQ